MKPVWKEKVLVAATHRTLTTTAAQVILRRFRLVTLSTTSANKPADVLKSSADRMAPPAQPCLSCDSMIVITRKPISSTCAGLAAMRALDNACAIDTMNDASHSQSIGRDRPNSSRSKNSIGRTSTTTR
jgi:hypothetical protein